MFTYDVTSCVGGRGFGFLVEEDETSDAIGCQEGVNHFNLKNVNKIIKILYKSRHTRVQRTCVPSKMASSTSE